MGPRLIHKILGSTSPHTMIIAPISTQGLCSLMAAQIINCFNVLFKLFQRLEMSALEFEISSSNSHFSDAKSELLPPKGM